MKDAKYLLALIIPLMAYASIYFAGVLSFLGFIVAFIIVPLVDQALAGTTENHDEDIEESRLKNQFFNFVLYLNLPLWLGILYFYFMRITTTELFWWEIVGLTISIGITGGGVGINVAHELGHRNTWYEQLMSKIILVTTFYLHFFIEHNQGHHKNVATDEDPASSRLGETFYAFFIRSVRDSYKSAWNIENTRLKRSGKAVLTVDNAMIWYTFIQLAYFVALFIAFGWIGAFLGVMVGILSFLMLETINYVEHYGLRRKKLASGKYESVKPYHSWNSNHPFGRILLYELTRHSDHHYKSTRKFQILRHFDESPQLPLGYPGSMLMAWVPPLWFKVMDKEVQKFNTMNEELVHSEFAVV